MLYSKASDLTELLALLYFVVMTNIKSRVQLRINSARASVRYWPHIVWGRAADVLDKIAEPASKLSTRCHDRWVLSGRDWEMFIDEKFPSDDRRPFFLNSESAPQTSKERENG